MKGRKSGRKPSLEKADVEDRGSEENTKAKANMEEEARPTTTVEANEAIEHIHTRIRT